MLCVCFSSMWINAHVAEYKACKQSNNTHSDGNIWLCSLEPIQPGMDGRLPAEFAVSRGSVASSWRLLHPHPLRPPLPPALGGSQQCYWRLGR